MASTKLNRQEYALVPGLGTQQDITKFITIVNQGEMAYATDTNEFFIFNGSQWQKIPFVLVSDSSNPDMGKIQTSSRIGLGTDYITDKSLLNCYIGSNTLTDNGAIRVNVENDPDTLEIYLRGAWNTIIYDFTTAYGDLRHVPVSEQIKVWSGDSVAVGLNGQPIIYEYQSSMGANPPPQVINLGSF